MKFNSDPSLSAICIYSPVVAFPSFFHARDSMVTEVGIPVKWTEDWFFQSLLDEVYFYVFSFKKHT